MQAVMLPSVWPRAAMVLPKEERMVQAALPVSSAVPVWSPLAQPAWWAAWVWSPLARVTGMEA
jgi:hypothetical protein